MKVIVTGATGMLGKQVARLYKEQGADVYLPSHKELDITNYNQVLSILKNIGPDTVVNCAAYTDVDGAEQEQEKAFLVNGLGPRFLALACRHCESTLIHISTDYIFNGEAKQPYQIYDTPCPINIYGASKLFGEAAVREIGGKFFVVRTSWLFGPEGKNFVDTIYSMAQQKDELKVVNDQQGAPTYTVDLAKALVDLNASHVYGTYHITNTGYTTWYGFAKKILKVAGFKTLVNPCATKDFPRPAARPHNSVLNPFPIEKVIGYTLPDWDNAVERHLQGTV
ncbi:dTDP-4-dehydrorhamnose reductase [Pelotomaculum schinkii]|uniref:dTDP-4-dehydrorhamnose reductase n=1 Tax=Pelotomaculum schinkii TaxID=78350 RepID=A0A4Y7R6Z4_9FIRM|nr:dTDP-4-dehydrorhamnose reductase [Pelotomaculum schinkii]TEB04617.1 dTDP-4-dehydrorhamnose reductase [Pelotomaculum schinkii]